MLMLLAPKAPINDPVSVCNLPLCVHQCSIAELWTAVYFLRVYMYWPTTGILKESGKLEALADFTTRYVLAVSHPIVLSS